MREILAAVIVSLCGGEAPTCQARTVALVRAESTEACAAEIAPMLERTSREHPGVVVSGICVAIRGEAEA